MSDIYIWHFCDYIFHPQQTAGKIDLVTCHAFCDLSRWLLALSSIITIKCPFSLAKRLYTDWLFNPIGISKRLKMKWAVFAIILKWIIQECSSDFQRNTCSGKEWLVNRRHQANTSTNLKKWSLQMYWAQLQNKCAWASSITCLFLEIRIIFIDKGEYWTETCNADMDHFRMACIILDVFSVKRQYKVNQIQKLQRTPDLFHLPFVGRTWKQTAVVEYGRVDLNYLMRRKANITYILYKYCYCVSKLLINVLKLIQTTICYYISTITWHGNAFRVNGLARGIHWSKIVIYEVVNLIHVLVEKVAVGK